MAAAGLLIAGALSQPRGGPDSVAGLNALDHVGGNGDNWSVMVRLVPFAAHPRSR